MTENKLTILEQAYSREGLHLRAELRCPFIPNAVPRVKAVYTCARETRRLPFLLISTEQDGGELITVCEYTFRQDMVFYGFTPKEDTVLHFEMYYGNEHILFDETLTIPPETMCRKTAAPRTSFKRRLHQLVRGFAGAYFRCLCALHPIKKGRISFLSGRRTTLGGNIERVYHYLKDDPSADIRFLFFSQSGTGNLLKNVRAFLLLYATSEVVVIDDFFRMMTLVGKRKGVKVVQLWHACGAFKTFGFSRLGKEGGPSQANRAHRMYDYAFVSSEEIVPHYAEGFGISDKKVLPLGVARCDAFFDEAYKQEVRDRFYDKYPQLRDKKLLLFAPTFRGNGQLSAHYPLDRMDLQQLYDDLDGEYAIIVKLHPFCRERYAVGDAYREVIVDLSDEDELNDLLFVTDLLVTDYSSVIFEASLMDIPMLFYAFDLEEYIAQRDFYYDYPFLVPGKIVTTQQELERCIVNEDFEREKVAAFKQRFFGSFKGDAARQAADCIRGLLSK